MYYRVLLADACIVPPLTSPPPKLDPTLAPDIKTAVQVTEKSASTVLICFVMATLCIFVFMRIYTPSRIIQMNMEISLILGHILAVLLPDLSEHTQVDLIYGVIGIFHFKYKGYINIYSNSIQIILIILQVCRIISIFPDLERRQDCVCQASWSLRNDQH